MDDEMVLDEAIRNSINSLNNEQDRRDMAKKQSIKEFEKRAHLFFKKVHMGFVRFCKIGWAQTQGAAWGDNKRKEQREGSSAYISES